MVTLPFSQFTPIPSYARTKQVLQTLMVQAEFGIAICVSYCFLGHGLQQPTIHGLPALSKAFTHAGHLVQNAYRVLTSAKAVKDALVIAELERQT